MASIATKTDNKALIFKDNKPRFFKIILDAIRHNGKLSFPRKFVREYGNNLSSRIVLKVCSGATWQVELIKCDGEIWLQKGWQEFVEYYSIAYGYLLVFEYEKHNCQFNVLIFDKSTSEIDYPFSMTNDGDNEEQNLDKELKEPNVETTKNDALVEIFDEEKSPLSFFQPRKKIKLENSTVQFDAKECNTSMSSEKENDNGISTRTEPLAANRKANALCRARKNFKSNNPFFMVAMQPSYIHNGAQVSIPATFSRKYFKNTRGDVIINDRNGKAWPARYVRCGRSSRIDNGWREFSKENQLEVGDVCVFELINHSEIELKVVIFRDIEHSNSSSSLVNKKEFKNERSSNGPRDVKASNKFTLVNPFFKIVIRSSYLKHNSVAVPIIFFSKFTEKNEEDIILEVDNGRWHVKLIKYPSYSKCKFSSGWNSFARENSLQHGDVCKFELTNAKNGQLKVSIFRNAN